VKLLRLLDDDDDDDDGNHLKAGSNVVEIQLEPPGIAGAEALTVPLLRETMCLEFGTVNQAVTCAEALATLVPPTALSRYAHHECGASRCTFLHKMST
jgi:hypothetical protein